MKKTFIFITVLILLGLAGWGIFRIVANHTTGESNYTETGISEKKLPEVSLVLDDGVTVATYSALTAATPYEALTQVAEANTIPLTVKQYDFGVYVEAIGESVNSNEKAWIYSVNGQAGTEAADRMELVSGDVVEWRYVVPTME